MADRRELSYSSWDEVVSDVERLASGSYRTTGNHSFAKIVNHLAITNEMLVGNVVPPKLPWYFRMLMPLMRSRILEGPVKPGFKLPNERMQQFFWSENELDLGEAIRQFKRSVDEYQSKGPLSVHPIFGKATADQILAVSLKHAAMHLSFVHAE